MKTINPTLVRVLQALGIKQLNEVQELAAKKGLFHKKGDFALLSMSRTGKSFAGGLFIANEMFKYITAQRKSGIDIDDGLSIFVAPFHASARGTAHMISQYYGWFLRPVVAIGDVHSTGLVLKLAEGYNPNVIVATPESLQDLLHTPESREWVQRHRIVAVVIDDIHSILHDPSRGLSLMEISSYFKDRFDSKPRRLILSAKIDSPERLTALFDIPIIEDPKTYEAPEITLVNYSTPKEKRKQLSEDLLDLAEDGTRTLVYMKAIDSIYDLLEAEGSELATSVSYDIDHLVLDRLGRISKVLEKLEYRLPDLVSSGVGCYHGQMSTAQRWFIEWAFRRRYLRFLFGTEALAYGVNTPVSHVVMESPGIDEVFRQSMMARAIRMRRGRGRPGKCTVYSQTIKDVQSLERVYSSPKLPIRFLARSQLSKALIGQIGLGLIRNEDDRKQLSEKLDLVFKKSSTSRVMKELMKTDPPFVMLSDADQYELTVLGVSSFESCFSEHQTRRVLEGIKIIQNTSNSPTEFDVLLLATYAMAVEDERSVSKEGVDRTLKRYLKSDVSSALLKEILGTDLERRWRRGIEYAAIILKELRDLDIEIKSRKRPGRLLTELDHFTPNFISLISALVSEDLCDHCGISREVATTLTQMTSSSGLIEMLTEEDDEKSHSLRWADLSFVDFSEIEMSIDAALRSDLTTFQKIRLLELLDAVESSTASFVQLAEQAKDQEDAKEVLQIVCSFSSEGLVGSNLVKALEEEGLVPRGTLDGLWNRFSTNVESIQKRTDLPAKAAGVLFSLFTGDIVGVATGGFQVLKRAAGRRKVDTSGFE